MFEWLTNALENWTTTKHWSAKVSFATAVLFFFFRLPFSFLYICFSKASFFGAHLFVLQSKGAKVKLISSFY